MQKKKPVDLIRKEKYTMNANKEYLNDEVTYCLRITFRCVLNVCVSDCKCVCVNLLCDKLLRLNEKQCGWQLCGMADDVSTNNLSYKIYYFLYE